MPRTAKSPIAGNTSLDDRSTMLLGNIPMAEIFALTQQEIILPWSDTALVVSSQSPIWDSAKSLGDLQTITGWFLDHCCTRCRCFPGPQSILLTVYRCVNPCLQHYRAHPCDVTAAWRDRPRGDARCYGDRVILIEASLPCSPTPRLRRQGWVTALRVAERSPIGGP